MWRNVSQNTAAAEGGGLWNGSGTMSVDGTTISNNTASGNDADQGGGGLFNAGGTLTAPRSQATSPTAPLALVAVSSTMLRPCEACLAWVTRSML